MHACFESLLRDVVVGYCAGRSKIHTFTPSVTLFHPSATFPQAFILCTGVFCSSWLGSALLQLGEFIIHRLPLITHIYGASKQARQYLPVYALH